MIRLRWLSSSPSHGASSGVPHMSGRCAARARDASMRAAIDALPVGVDGTQRMASSLGHFSGVRGRIDTVEVAMVSFVAWRV